jgi:hypothetical protein
VTALSILAQATAAGLTLRPYGEKIRFKPVENMTAELLAEVREHKQELVTLLRSQRQAEVGAAFAEGFSRLGALYPDALAGTLWERVTTEHPALARSIDTAEAAADGAAVAYQSGTVADSSQFLACLSTWETAWAEAIQAITGGRCSDCGARAVVLVTTDYGPKYCRACLRPEPIGTAAKGRTHA